MTDKVKKIIFWAVVALVICGILIYLKFAPFWDAVMALVTFLIGIAVGNVCHRLYSKRS